jgi:hypothetical protein|tara:strand:+ start:638 stop:808 length:171 start_codon:yes stop_codon:yes gene_type:complete
LEECSSFDNVVICIEIGVIMNATAKFGGGLTTRILTGKDTKNEGIGVIATTDRKAE